MNTIPNPLYQRSVISPKKIALVYKDEHITFGDLHSRVLKRVQTLRKFGAKKDSHIGLLMNSSPEFVITYFAISYIGAAAVLFNTRLTRDELRLQYQIARVEFVVIDSEYTGIFEQERQVRNEEVECGNYLKEYELRQICSILFTSGTTGRPKAVQLTIGNHYFSAMAAALNNGVQVDDCYLACMPLFHVGGLSIVHRSIFYGMKVVLLPKFELTNFIEVMKKESVTHMSLVTKMITDLLQIEMFTSYSKNIRSILLGGGSVPKALLEKCVELQLPVQQTYGMTETSSQVVTLSPEDIVRKVGSCGKPLMTTQLKIVKNGDECIANEEGEILIKSPAVMKGYYDQEEANKESFQDGWFHTGDIGYVDEEGYLYLVDRRSDLIISGGENIYPSEIEHVLLLHPNVKEVGVVGKADKTWGKVPVAFIVSNTAITTEELQQFCSQKLAKYKIPKEYTFVSSLPRTASQKLQRHKLLDNRS